MVISGESLISIGIDRCMKNIIKALEKNKTWHLVDCKWVFRIKRKADGTIDRDRRLGLLRKASNNGLV